MTGRFWRVRRRLGGVAPLVAISLVMLLSFVALAVDAGYIYVSRAQMQRAVDASALAGASALPDGEGPAVARAVDAAGRNAVGGTPVSEQEATVIIGRWEGTAREFYPASEGDEVTPNAVRVIGARPDVPLFLARVMGNSTTDVVKDAIALSHGAKCIGVWGLQGVTGDGNVFTDSYDPDRGPYGPGNINAYGDLCSCQNVDLRGDVDINGNVMWGEGYSLLTSGSSYYIAGSRGEQRCQEFVPDIDMEEAAFNNDNATIGQTDLGRDPFGGSQWDLVVTGQDNLTLTGGTYYFTSALIDGQATLTITGPTTIYVAGSSFFTGGGVANVTEDPANLLIYSTGPTVNLSGNAGFYGAVIAPAADLVLEGTGDYYGTILGRTLDMDGTAFIHVDERLAISLFDLETSAPVLVE
jgi:Flp pilus assembly protein TadG